MQSIRKRLGFGFIISSIISILLITIFVNFKINNVFKVYMEDIQNKKYESIVSYFEEVYKKENGFTNNSGKELAHDASMSNYCITLLDSNKKIIWGMDPNNMIMGFDFNTMRKEDKGIYTTKTFEIFNDGILIGYVEIGQYSSILMSQEDIAFISSINESIIAGAIIAIISGVIISYYLSKQFSKPITEVTDISLKLAEGKFTTNNSMSNIREIEDLKLNINRLAKQLKCQEDLRKQLVTDISHEIRTPLNILQNNLEAMVDGIFPITSERLIKLNGEVIRFGKLLDSLDLLKQFEIKSINLDFDELDLCKLLHEVCDEFQIEAENKNIRINRNISKDKLIIKGDINKLRQVFFNLLSNSIKFNNNNGEINISLIKNENNIVCEISDTGIGISIEDLPFIFERMYRADKSRNTIEGNGVGLTIVKNILDSHGASINVDSKIGVGTKFIITF